MKRGENGAAKNVQPLKNVAASGVDANPSSDCLSRSIEAHGGKQAPFYPVHSRQRERWTDGAPRLRRLRYTLSLSRCISLPLSLSLCATVSFFPSGPLVSFLFQLVLVSFSFRGLGTRSTERAHTAAFFSEREDRSVDYRRRQRAAWIDHDADFPHLVHHFLLYSVNLVVHTSH